jgi:hypothetical protein
MSNIEEGLIQDIKDIFDDFADDNNYQKYDWNTQDNSNLGLGINYTYLDVKELNKNIDKKSLAKKIIKKMLSEKYLSIIININENNDDNSNLDSVISKINKYFAKRVSALGCEVSFTTGKGFTDKMIINTINLKIDYLDCI